MIAGLAMLWEKQAALESYWRNVYSNATFMWSGADAWNANMQDVKRRIDELAENGRLGIAVKSQTVTPDQWKAVHHTCWDAVSGQAQINGSSPSLWNDFLVPTATEVYTDVADTVDAAGDKIDFLTSPLGLLLIFGLLVTVLLVKVA